MRPLVELRRWLALLLLSVTLAACSTSHSLAATRFEIRAASLEASTDWQVARLRNSSDTLYVSPDVLLDNADVAQAIAKQDLGGQVFLLIELTPAGSARLLSASRTLLHQRMAAMLNGEVLMAPLVSAPLSGNRFAITGFTSMEEAQTAAQGILGRP